MLYLFFIGMFAHSFIISHEKSVKGKELHDLMQRIYLLEESNERKDKLINKLKEIDQEGIDELDRIDQEYRAKLVNEINMLKSHIMKLSDKHEKLKFVYQNAIDELALLRSNRNNTNFDRSFIKKLLILAHPDKHNNSDLSVSMTKELNRLRK